MASASPGLLLVASTLVGHAAHCRRGCQPIAIHAQDQLDRGYVDLYNLDFPSAHAEFAAWIQAHPNDPLGTASDAAAYLFSEFDRLSVIDVQLFADQSRFDSRGKLTPDPAARKAFESRADQTNQLADAALTHNPKDANALYAKTLVCGMRSDYAMMIDKHDVEALSFSKQASALSRQTLAISPTMYDAYLASGVENYMLSLKWAPLRWLLSWGGAGTDRQEGLRLLGVTASQGHYLGAIRPHDAGRGRHPRGTRATGPRYPYRALKRIPPKQPLHPRAGPHPLDSYRSQAAPKSVPPSLCKDRPSISCASRPSVPPFRPIVIPR